MTYNTCLAVYEEATAYYHALATYCRDCTHDYPECWFFNHLAKNAEFSHSLTVRNMLHHEEEMKELTAHVHLIADDTTADNTVNSAANTTEHTDLFPELAVDLEF